MVNILSYEVSTARGQGHYFDVGLGVNYLGAQSRQVIAESLEVAPFHKQLFSSDAWGPSELHLFGSLQWRRGISSVVGGWGDCGFNGVSGLTR